MVISMDAGGNYVRKISQWSYISKIPGINKFEDIGLIIESFQKNIPGQFDLKALWCEIDLDKCDLPLLVRNFLNGDRVVVNGKEKKLKTIFHGQGIPENWRKKVPILCDQKKILWIPGILLDERAQVQENSKSIFIVSMRTGKR